MPDDFQSFRTLGNVAAGMVAKLEAQRPPRITAPGLYQMPADVYHSDPLPDPSLSRSIARLLVTRSPRHAWCAHPRLNPNFVDDRKVDRKVEIANVAHALFLHAGADRIIEIDDDEYRTKDAKEARSAAYAAGRQPILTPDYAIARAMVDVARVEFGAYREFAHVLAEDGGSSELVGVCRDGDAWLRIMLDRVSMDLRIGLDLKTTGNSHPDACAARISDNDFQMQHPFYFRVLDALDPAGRGRRKFYFLYQEQEEPYACTVHELDSHHRQMGERQVEAAIQIWKDCIASGQWPAYPHMIHRVEMKPWAEQRWLAREENEPALAPRLTVLDAG